MLTSAIRAAQPASGEDWKIIVALVAAALGLLGVAITLLVNGRRAESERLRELYASGWAAVQAYKEMAFAIRRRDAGNRAAERVRLSEAMREIQKDLAYYEALIGRERSGRIAAEYRILIAKTREIAGGVIRRSWNDAPIETDDRMHSPEIATEVGALKPFEDSYMNAVADRLGGVPSASARPRPAATETTTRHGPA